MDQPFNIVVPQSSNPIADKEYEFIRKTVYEFSRINLGPNKKELVMARLAKRLRALGLPDYAAYCQLLQSPASSQEMTHLIDAISTNHTFFFRETAHFEFMINDILPPWSEKKTSGGFRVWSAACSTGEEPYTIALLMNEYLLKHPGFDWRIECTDISSTVLKKAQEGIFPEERLSQAPMEYLRRYFQKGDGRWAGFFRAKPELRRNMNFTLLNLLKPPYPFREPFNLIFCRNVMIYFDRPTQEQLVRSLHEKLVPGGYLFIGHAESLTAIQHDFEMLRPAIYRKKS